MSSEAGKYIAQGTKAKIRVAGIAMVKDECDIIELFVKINMRCLDHLFIVDHGSRDGTPEILRRLVASGCALTVTQYEGLNLLQSEITTSLLNSVAQMDEYDFIMPIDADEFIYCGDHCLADVLVAEVPPGGAAQMRWVTYAPVVTSEVPVTAPLFERFRMRAQEPVQFYKVVVSNDLAKRARLPAGNHGVLVDDLPVPLPTLTVILQHAPLRSAEQLVAKALIGSLRYSIRVGRNPLEGYHWDQMSEFIRAADYVLGPHDVFRLACRYATDLSSPAPELEQVIDSAPRIGRFDDVIEYPELCRINPVRNFDHFSAALSAELLEHRTAQSQLEARRQAWPRRFAKWRRKIDMVLNRSR